MIASTSTPAVNLGASALLIWLKEGLEPRSGLFESKPEGIDLGPVSWPRFDLALSYAMHMPRTDERVPWIKSGGRVIRPGELRAIFNAGEPYSTGSAS